MGAPGPVTQLHAMMHAMLSRSVVRSRGTGLTPLAGRAVRQTCGPPHTVITPSKHAGLCHPALPTALHAHYCCCWPRCKQFKGHSSKCKQGRASRLKTVQKMRHRHTHTQKKLDAANWEPHTRAKWSTMPVCAYATHSIAAKVDSPRASRSILSAELRLAHRAHSLTEHIQEEGD